MSLLEAKVVDINFVLAVANIIVIDIHNTHVHVQYVQVITMRHVVDGIRSFGPVYGSWMFAYERFNSWLHRRVMNRRLETYRVCLLIMYMRALFGPYIKSQYCGGLHVLTARLYR